MPESPEPPARSRLVGVLGGMGPRATVDFYDKLVTATAAATDQEHVRVVIWADPTVPNRQDALLRDGPSPRPALERGLRALRDAGAELLVVPCNTVHHFLDGLVPPELELVDVVEETVAAVQRRTAASAGSTGVGVLATDAFLRTGLLQRALEAAGHDVLLPPPRLQARLTEVVEGVKAGRPRGELLLALTEVTDDLAAADVQVVVAACTELSSLVDPDQRLSGLTVVDPSLVLAEATVRRAFATAGQTTTPQAPSGTTPEDQSEHDQPTSTTGVPS